MQEGSSVTEDSTNKEQSIRARFDESEQQLSVLEQKLQAVNAELRSLAEKGREYGVLGELCRSLQELENLGAADLFWTSRDDYEMRDAKLASVQQKIDEYGIEINRIEDRRDSILEQIGDQNQALDLLHYDLLDAVEIEENRKNEWLVERDADEIQCHSQVMPWARGNEEDQRFHKSLGTSLAVSIMLAILVGSVAIPIIERKQLIEVPERVAKLVERNRIQPQPEPQPVIEETLPEPEPEKLAEELPEEIVPQAISEPAVADNATIDIKAKVKSKGILAFRESFARRASLRPTAQLGSQARLSNAGENAVGRPQRAMVTTNAPGSSGGINLASISRDIGGGGQGLDGVQVSRVSSSIGTGGDGSSNRPLSGGAFAGRTDEEIQIVFDRYKSSLYRLYNRELRKNPTLRGQMILKLTIEPNGVVSFCVMQSSDMDAPALAEKVVERVIGFNFGAKEDIVAVTIIYPIDFLPAA